MKMVRALLGIGLTASLCWSWSSKQASLGGLDGFVERMGAGVREQAMGNAAISDSSAQPGAFWNPALVTSSRNGIDITLNGEDRSLGRSGTSLSAQGGVGSRMGVGFAFLEHGTSLAVINEEDQNLGSASPYFYMAYISIGWRVDRANEIGLGFSKSGYDLDLGGKYSDMTFNNSEQSPLSYTLGWHHTWNSTFESGLVLRNLGFSKTLTTTWVRSPATDGDIASSDVFRPKSLEVGTTYHTKIAKRPFNMSIEVLDYLLADTLMTFDPDWHYWTARMGLEWEAISDGYVRAGYDSGNLSAGLGYRFNLRWEKKPWPLEVDWALSYESVAGLWNPLSVGVKTRIP